MGELDDFSSSRIRELLLGIVGSSGELVIDADAVCFIDSAGIDLLEAVCGRAAADDKRVWPHDPSPVIARVIALVGADGITASCFPGRTNRHECRPSSAALFSRCPGAPKPVRGEHGQHGSPPTSVLRGSTSVLRPSIVGLRPQERASVVKGTR